MCHRPPGRGDVMEGIEPRRSELGRKCITIPARPSFLAETFLAERCVRLRPAITDTSCTDLAARVVTRLGVRRATVLVGSCCCEPAGWSRPGDVFPANEASTPSDVAPELGGTATSCTNG